MVADAPYSRSRAGICLSLWNRYLCRLYFSVLVCHVTRRLDVLTVAQPSRQLTCFRLSRSGFSTRTYETLVPSSVLLD